jgi:hypothetical protein
VRRGRTSDGNRAWRLWPWRWRRTPGTAVAASLIRRARVGAGDG